MRIYRHGDILLKQIGELPKKTKKLNHLVLAEGEVTGHKHEVQVANKEDCRLMTDNQGRMYLEVATPSPLTHQEHDTIKIKKGVYVVEHEQEYDPFEEEIRRVQD